MTPTTSTPRRDSWLRFAWPRDRGPTSGPAPPLRSRGITTTSGLFRRKAEGCSRRWERILGLGVGARRIACGQWGRSDRNGRESPLPTGGRRRTLGWKSLRGVFPGGVPDRDSDRKTRQGSAPVLADWVRSEPRTTAKSTPPAPGGGRGLRALENLGKEREEEEEERLKSSGVCWEDGGFSNPSLPCTALLIHTYRPSACAVVPRGAQDLLLLFKKL